MLRSKKDQRLINSKLQTMKKLTILLVAITLLYACGNNRNETEKLGEIKVEIPVELKGNKQVLNYIEGVTGVANSYAALVDDMFDDVGEYAGMDESELSMMDKLKLVRATGEMTIKSAEIMSKWSKFTDMRMELDKQLSDAEVEALNQVWKQFEQRMEQVHAKHCQAFENSKENQQ